MSCIAEDNEAYYSLASLSSPTDYTFKSLSGAVSFSINVCQSVKTDLWNVKDVPEDKVGGFYRGKSGDFSIGTANDTVQIVDGNPVLWLVNGSPCPDAGNQRASTAIRFICDHTAGDGQPQLIAQFPQEDEQACSYFVEWKTTSACPTGLKGAGILHQFAIFASIFIVALLVYLVGALLFNRFFLGLRGLDALPSIPCVSCNWITNCFGWIHDKITGRGDGFVGGPRLSGWGSRARNGFQRIPEEEEGLTGDHRFSLDDEEDEDDERRANGNGNGFHMPNEWANSGRERGGMGSDGVIRL